MPNPIVHFEIPADDVARAQTFYQSVFGWKIKQMPMPAGGIEYYGVTTRNEGQPGINGGLMKRNMPGQPFANYVAVKSIDEFLAKVTASGGSVILPRQGTLPGMGSIAVKAIADCLARVTGRGGSVVLRRQEIAPGRGSIAVKSIAEFLAKVTASGGSVILP